MYLFHVFLAFCSIVSIQSLSIISIESVSNTSVVFTCADDTVNVDYVFELKINLDNISDNVDVYEMSKTITRVVVNKLTPGTTYFIEFWALKVEGTEMIDHGNFTTKPSPPLNLKFLYMNETGIGIEWTAPQISQNINTYLMSLSNESKTGLVHYEIESDQQLTSKNISGLLPGKVYNLVIINSIIDGNHNVIVSEPLYTRFRTRPLPPTNLKVDQNTLSSHSFVIKWDSPKNSELDGYSISYKFNSQTFTKFIEKNYTSHISTHMVNTSLRISESIYPGQTYLIKLNSVVLGGAKSQSIESRPVYREVTTRPLPVINLKSKPINKSEIYIKWKDSPHSTQDFYRISYKDVDTENELVIMTNRTNILLKDLSYGKNYSITVVALSNNIRSNSSSIYHVVIMKSATYIPIFIGLIILSLIIIVSMQIYSRIKRNKQKKNEDENWEQGTNLPLVEQNRPGNIYEEFGPMPPIDEKLKIKREELELEKEIGRGQFGTVYSGLILMEKAQFSKKEPVAIKTSSFNERDMNSFLKEALIMKNFKHENVLSLYGVCLEADGSPLVVLPFMKNGDLLKYIRDEGNAPTVKQLINFVIDVANGMDYLSTQQFIHRDLAARNCMLDEDLTVKIADFGLSRHLKSNNPYVGNNSKQLLPIRWMSVESIEKGVYDTKTDVWSYGVLIWEVITRGVNPYPDLENREILKYLKGGHRLPQPTYCPNLIYETICQCWDIEPNKRPLFNELGSNLRDIITQLEANVKHKPVNVNEANIYYDFSQGAS